MIVLWPASEKMEASTPPAGARGGRLQELRGQTGGEGRYFMSDRSVAGAIKERD